jgi:hypothetical protein
VIHNEGGSTNVNQIRDASGVNLNQGTGASQNIDTQKPTSWKKVIIAIAGAIVALAGLATAVVKLMS